MNTTSVKQSVVENYGKLAKSKKNGLFAQLFACCSPEDTSRAVAENIGYTKEELDQVPNDSNLGVGCGNPAAFARMKKGETVIDLGSGAGFDAFIVAPIVGTSGQVIGVDLSDEMLELAISNKQSGNFNQVEFVKGDIEELPLKEGIADHVISNCVINLSLDKGSVYKEAYRVLKPGGRLSISDVVLEKELPDFIKNSLAGHIACVSGAEKIEDYLQYVKAAGFVDIKIETKKAFPLELVLTDPQVMKIAHEMKYSLDSKEAKEVASTVSSITFSAKKA